MSSMYSLISMGSMCFDVSHSMLIYLVLLLVGVLTLIYQEVLGVYYLYVLASQGARMPVSLVVF